MRNVSQDTGVGKLTRRGDAMYRVPRMARKGKERTGCVMDDLTLMIGNRNYLSRSLRPWLAMRHAGIPFEERLILLFDENWEESVAKVSPSGRVPALLLGERTVWETLVILKCVNELFPDAGPLAVGSRCPRPRPLGFERNAHRLHGAPQPHADEPAPR